MCSYLQVNAISPEQKAILQLEKFNSFTCDFALMKVEPRVGRLVINDVSILRTKNNGNKLQKRIKMPSLEDLFLHKISDCNQCILGERDLFLSASCKARANTH